MPFGVVDPQSVLSNDRDCFLYSKDFYFTVFVSS